MARWAAISPVAIVVLVLVAFFSVFITLVCEHGLGGFRVNPDPTRIGAARGYIKWEKFASFLLFASVIALVSIFGVWISEGEDDWFAIALSVLLALAATPYLRAPLYWMLGPNRLPLPRESLPPHGAARLPSFAAALPPDDEPGDFETFKLFIAPTMLCGARVTNKVGEDSGDLLANFRSAIYLDAAFYDAFDVTLPAFGKLNADNFQIAWRDVAGIDCDPVSKRKRIIDAPNSGSITLKLKSGATRELIVLGKRDVAALRDKLQGIAAWPGDPPAQGA